MANGITNNPNYDPRIHRGIKPTDLYDDSEFLFDQSKTDRALRKGKPVSPIWRQAG